MQQVPGCPSQETKGSDGSIDNWIQCREKHDLWAWEQHRNQKKQSKFALWQLKRWIELKEKVWRRVNLGFNRCIWWSGGTNHVSWINLNVKHAFFPLSPEAFLQLHFSNNKKKNSWQTKTVFPLESLVAAAATFLCAQGHLKQSGPESVEVDQKEKKYTLDAIENNNKNSPPVPLAFICIYPLSVPDKAKKRISFQRWKNSSLSFFSGILQDFYVPMSMFAICGEKCSPTSIWWCW